MSPAAETPSIGEHAQAGRRTVSVEKHSIDFVPLSERYGSPRRLFTIWFSCNLSILGVAVGTLAVAAGLSFATAVAALALGNAIGTVFVAAHSAQGPHLGIPQMIQSRAQFGVLGAGLPLVAVVLTYMLYSAADGLIVERSLQSLLSMSSDAALVVFALSTLLIAFIGYELIHRAAAVLTFVSAGLFATAAYLLATGHGTHVAFFSGAGTASSFTGAAFVLTMTQAAAWSLSYGPYVADYSRYLPPSVAPSATFWYTGLGCFLGSTLIMAFGVYLASVSPALANDPADAVASVFRVGRPLVELLIIVGVVQGNVLNLYSAYMSTATIFSGIRRMTRVSPAHKLVFMALLMAISTLISLMAQDRFQAYFSDMLSAMIYLLVPWSAINLVDYYLVRKGRYDVAAMFRIDGEYGAYRWKTLGIYLLGILLQEPFMSLSFFKGPAAQWIGADVAWLPGLLIPGLLHWLVEG